jgi:hypothetical protein
MFGGYFATYFITKSFLYLSEFVVDGSESPFKPIGGGDFSTLNAL